MNNLDHILTHIEASAPCTLFSVAVWADSQLSINAVTFTGIIDMLILSNSIEINTENNALIVDLI
jgi:Mn2+/Fe2+ NRAMP family transporter